LYNFANLFFANLFAIKDFLQLRRSQIVCGWLLCLVPTIVVVEMNMMLFMWAFFWVGFLSFVHAYDSDNIKYDVLDWEKCKRCTREERVFCYTTFECLPDLHIDTPTTKIFSKCPNPLMVPESCRTKGVHPPNAEQKEQYRAEHLFEQQLKQERIRKLQEQGSNYKMEL